MATGRLAVGDVDRAEMDCADLGRVVVEQSHEPKSGTKSATSSSSHSRRRPLSSPRRRD
jgi:hypothetical protein